MSMSGTDIILQENTPFAKSDLWKWQKKFFEEQGINAWARQVPFYITCNPSIANAYANIIIRFIQDWVGKSNYNPLEPFYILELGTGSGKFSFYTIKRLLDLREQFDMEEIKLKYIMTDFTQNNIKFWKNHPALAAYIKEGIVDFAQFDAEVDQQINLINSNIVLDQKKGLEKNANPIIVLANYVFDTIPHDVFNIHDGQLQEGLATITIPKEKFMEGSIKELSAISTKFCYRDCDINYYPDNTLQAVLAYYKNNYKNLKLLVPSGSLNCIKNLQKISGDKLLLLATDKGFTNYLQDFMSAEPGIAFHSSFSLMVNFDAIGLYFRYLGGDHFYQKSQQDVLTCAYLLGRKFKQMPETKKALINFIDHFSPVNLYKIYQHLSLTIQACNISMLLAYLEMANWDPQLFDDYIEIIINDIKKVNCVNVKDMLAALVKIADNYYYLPAANNTLFNIGRLLQAIHEHAEAIKYYNKALEYQSNREATYFNIGICYYALENYSRAAELLEQVLAINKENILAHGWLVKTQKAIRSEEVNATN